MAGRVLHFGFDDCHRREVLRRDGYEVVEARSLSELVTSLRDAAVSFDAVVLTEDDEMKPASVLRTVRRETGSPVILFRRTNRDMDERGFDRVIHWLTAPVEWLHEVDLLITEHRGLSSAAD